MTLISIRKQLHQLIDALPEKYLLELWQFIQKLQTNRKDDKQSLLSSSDSSEVIAKFENTSPQLNNTKPWTKQEKLLEAINATYDDLPDPEEEKHQQQMRYKHKQLVNEQDLNEKIGSLSPKRVRQILEGINLVLNPSHIE